MKYLKILVITNHYPPFIKGGYEIACKETVDQLRFFGHNVTVLTENKRVQDSDNQILRKLNYIDYKKHGKLKRVFLDVLNKKVTATTIKEESPDIIYIWSLRGLGLRLLQEVSDKKKLFEIGDMWMKGYQFQIDKYNIDFSPAICVSKWLRDDFIKSMDVKKELTYVIPNSLKEINYIETKIKNNKFENKNHPVQLGFVGRIEADKGFHVAIKALNRLHKMNIKFDFVVFGSGEKDYIRYCKSLCQFPLENIKWMGFEHDTKKIYKSFDILLMPTLVAEAFGLVIIEAMANGVIPIATNSTGPKEIISNKFGRLFEYMDDEDFAQSIIDIIYHPNKNKLIESGYREVSEKYLSINVKRNVESVLFEVFNGN